MVSVHRFQGGVKDRLFQNNVNTHTGITLTISLAELKRDLSHDWVFPYQEVVEIHMSPAQWHQLLTEMNTLGVPCTLSHYFDKDGTFIRPVFPEDFDNELKRIEREFEEAIRRLETLSPEMAETLKGIYPKLSRKDAEALRGVVEGLHATLKSHIPFVRKAMEDAVSRTVEHGKAEMASFVDAGIRQAGLQHLKELAPRLPALALG
jgi:hypothetical protein